MAEWNCHKCVYARVDSEQWLRYRTRPELLLVKCANHPFFPGQLREVPGAGCPNFRPKPPEPKGEVRHLPLGDGHYAIVDTADYEELSQYTWHFHNGYAMRWENRREVYMHRQIMNPPKGKVVDHVNHNRVDNRRSNLRICNRRQNIFNQPSKRATASPFKGVSYRKYPSGRRKCYAQIRIDGKKTYLGSFAAEADAARAYDRAAVEHHGEFAHLNFPEEWPSERRAAVRAGREDAPEDRGQKTKNGKAEGKKTARKEGKRGFLAAQASQE